MAPERRRTFCRYKQKSTESLDAKFAVSLPSSYDALQTPTVGRLCRVVCSFTLCYTYCSFAHCYQKFDDGMAIQNMARSSSATNLHASTPEYSQEGLNAESTEKACNDPASSLARPLSIHLFQNADVTWLYLEFDADLPQPVYLSHPELYPDTRARPPQCPDLRNYTSPFTWADSRKSVMLWISCAATMFTAYNAGAYTSGLDQMKDEWQISQVAGLLGVTLFTVGFGLAPMFLAPFSEINGRRPVFLVSGVLFVIFQIVCAVTPSFAGMLISRFLVGCFSSTFSTMVGGVISDIYHAKDRNTAMTLFSASALTGTGLGPLVSGFIGQNTTWRWIFYLQIIIDAVLIGFVILFFNETRGSVLLSRKAQKLNKYYESLESVGYYGFTISSSSMNMQSQLEKTPPTRPIQTTIPRLRWKVVADEERASLTTMLRISLLRPFHMLFTEPVVFFFSLWISFSWGVLYMTFSAIPLIFSTTYSFNLQETGAIFSASSIASILFTFVAIYQERLLKPHLPESQKRILESPEGRLYFACAESALLPIGCLWFCISGSYPNCPWIVPALGLGCATIGVFSIYLSVFNYLADSYHRYASSALAAQSFCRNMLAGAFPLFTRQMFKAMTFQGAGGFLGGVGFLLTGVPLVLLLFGPKIRAKSDLASEIMKNSGEKDRL
ncbi:hypothetical protein AC579_3916 [Pseudocercospora musae]|uniref:Major facilitator superfamily (MFS) profile domain-containing protein n=1 Tax=Pseudocercospora musae TaxID=113226 RepID=A0A139HA71_9PEZI|nr:hypothetical protein AC579_3916 [Pseudocercospora musae]